MNDLFGDDPVPTPRRPAPGRNPLTMRDEPYVELTQDERFTVVLDDPLEVDPKHIGRTMEVRQITGYGHRSYLAYGYLVLEKPRGKVSARKVRQRLSAKRIPAQVLAALEVQWPR